MLTYKEAITESSVYKEVAAYNSAFSFSLSSLPMVFVNIYLSVLSCEAVKT